MAGGCDWSTLAVLKYVLDFLGPYAKNVKEVCSEWKKCKGLYSRLNFDHMFGMSSGEMHEKFCEIFKRTEVGGVRSLSFRECDFVDDLMLNGLMVYVNLEELNLSLCKNFTNVGLASVGRMRGIRKLKLIENKCVSGNVGCLVDLENLEDLDLECCELVRDDFVELGRLKSLCVLNLRGCLRGGDGLGLGLLGVSMSLRDLNLEYCSALNDDDMKVVGRMVGLRKLSLTYCVGVGDRGIGEIVGLIELEELCLDLCNVSDDGLRQFGATFGGKLLRKLSLWGCKKVNNLDKFMCTPMGSKVEDLNVGSCKLVNGFNNMGGIRVLNMNRCDGSFQIDDLMKGLRGGKLRSLSMCECSKDLSGLMDGLDAFDLDELRLGSTSRQNISSLSAKKIGGLLNLKTLEINNFNMSHKNLGFMLLDLNNLETLALHRCYICYVDADIISSLRGLRSLSLLSAYIDDKTIETLMRELNRLENLSISFCQYITDKSVHILSSHERLRSIYIGGDTGISKEGKMKLYKMCSLRSLR